MTDDLIYAAPAPPLKEPPMTAEPDALRLVPVEPTEAMIEAGNRALSPWVAPAMHSGDAYRAMLAALTPPAEPVSRPGDGVEGENIETSAWRWLSRLYPNDAPSDLAYDANEMVDAFVAGAGEASRMAKALWRISEERQYRAGYCQTDFAVEPALTAEEAQAVAREALSPIGRALTPPAEPVSRPAGEREAVAWPVVTDQWAETYCELTGRDPDGQQVTFVDGGTVTTFRDMARREIEAMLCAAPKSAVRTIATAEPAEARIRELERQLRIVQNAAKTLHHCRDTELQHLRENATFDHRLRAEHESLMERDAMMTDLLEQAEVRATAAEAKLARVIGPLKDIRAGGSWQGDTAADLLAALQQEGE